MSKFSRWSSLAFSACAAVAAAGLLAPVPAEAGSLDAVRERIHKDGEQTQPVVRPAKAASRTYRHGEPNDRKRTRTLPSGRKVVMRPAAPTPAPRRVVATSSGRQAVVRPAKSAPKTYSHQSNSDEFYRHRHDNMTNAHHHSGGDQPHGHAGVCGHGAFKDCGTPGADKNGPAVNAGNAGNAANSGNAGNANSATNAERRLRALKQLYDDGLLSDDEYQQKRLEILRDL